MPYVIQSIDGQRHLDQDGLISWAMESSPWVFQSEAQATAHDVFSGAEASNLRPVQVAAAEVVPGLPVGAVCADEVIEALQGKQERMMRDIARQEITLHEIRFSVSGVAIGICGCLGWLVASGRF
jgi:hypothetical protein